MGARLQRFLHSVTTGYAVLAAGAVYGFGTIPLALQHLNTETFGVFALSSQLIAYLAMIDFGMTPSIARSLIDAKDAKDNTYARMVSTSFAVQFVQALLIALAGLLLVPWLTVFFPVNPALEQEFRRLFLCQATLQALTFLTRILDRLLYAHQRQYYINYGQILYYATAFAALALGLKAGLGLMSLVLSQGTGWIFSTALSWMACRKHALLPPGVSIRLVSGPVFRQLFRLGRDMFLAVLGAQLILASQVLVIGRTLGTEAGAVWSIATKAFFFGAQLLWRLFDYSMPALSEMMSRGENDLLRRRFMEIVNVTLTASVVAGVAFAFLNGPFLRVWTGGRIAWHWSNDLALGFWLVQLAYFHNFAMLILTSKEIRFMRYIYLLEGILCVAASVFLMPVVGLTGMIASYAVLGLFLSGVYCIWRTRGILGVTAGWLLQPAFAILARTLPLTLALLGAVHFAVPPAWPAAARLGLLALATGVAGIISLAFFGITPAQRAALLARLGRIMKG